MQLGLAIGRSWSVADALLALLQVANNEADPELAANCRRWLNQAQAIESELTEHAKAHLERRAVTSAASEGAPSSPSWRRTVVHSEQSEAGDVKGRRESTRYHPDELVHHQRAGTNETWCGRRAFSTDLSGGRSELLQLSPVLVGVTCAGCLKRFDRGAP